MIGRGGAFFSSGRSDFLRVGLVIAPNLQNAGCLSDILTFNVAGCLRLFVCFVRNNFVTDFVILFFHFSPTVPGRVRVALRLRPRNSEELAADADFADCVELQPEVFVLVYSIHG